MIRKKITNSHNDKQIELHYFILISPDKANTGKKLLTHIMISK